MRGHDLWNAARAAEYAIIAVPWAAVIDLTAHLVQLLSGKVAIDLRNPLSPDRSSLVVWGTDAAAAQAARALPGSTVVKALNGVTTGNSADPEFSGPWRRCSIAAITRSAGW
ncbi:MAG: NAD(P)-binding domain-containing protein [Acidiferrobacteraceae bacterium]